MSDKVKTNPVVNAAFHQILNSHEIGGAGLIALGLGKFINTRGRKCHMWIPADGPMQKKAEESGLAHHLYDCAGLLSAQKVTAVIANGRFGYHLRRFGHGVAHIHSPAYYGALRLGLRMAGVKRVVHVHLEETGSGLEWAFKESPEVIITCARYMVEEVRESLPEQCRERQRIDAIPNAVDTAVFYPDQKSEAKAKVGAPMEAPLIVMLANLAPHKGQVTAIKAVALLKDQGVQVACWLAGSERQGTVGFADELRSLISELGVEDRVRLAGYREDAPDLLRAADFFLLPSTHEGLPVSILEAQATQVPVLAAPTPGACEVIKDGVTGFLISHDDPAGYASSIRAVLTDPVLRQRLTQNAFDIVTVEYTWSRYCERIWDLYCELLGLKNDGYPPVPLSD